MLAGCEISGAREAATSLTQAADRGANLLPVTSYFGRFMVGTSIPKNFVAGGRPKWPGVERFGSSAQPLRDTGRLMGATDFTPSEMDLIIGNSLVYARLHQEGGKVVPKRAQYLTIPHFPALSISEVHAKRARDFPGAFVLMQGPQGPGLYIKGNRNGAGVRMSGGSWAASVSASRGRRARMEPQPITLLFSFVKSVTVPARPFLLFQDQDLDYFSELVTAFLFSPGAQWKNVPRPG